MSATELKDEICAALQAHADPDRGEQMQRYMKSSMPYYGVMAPEQKQIFSAAFKSFPLSSREQWLQAVRLLWEQAKYREERYAALALIRLGKYKKYRDLDTLPLYQQMIVEGAWWDYVDPIASQFVWELLKNYPGELREIVLKYSVSDNIWLRRTAIICQLKAKDKIDLPLLYQCIEPSIGEKEFFLRKAIGWALRSHSAVDPHEVVRYVEENESRLSPLSKREALKNVEKHLKSLQSDA